MTSEGANRSRCDRCISHTILLYYIDLIIYSIHAPLTPPPGRRDGQSPRNCDRRPVAWVWARTATSAPARFAIDSSASTRSEAFPGRRDELRPDAGGPVLPDDPLGVPQRVAPFATVGQLQVEVAVLPRDLADLGPDPDRLRHPSVDAPLEPGKQFGERGPSPPPCGRRGPSGLSGRYGSLGHRGSVPATGPKRAQYQRNPADRPSGMEKLPRVLERTPSCFMELRR